MRKFADVHVNVDTSENAASFAITMRRYGYSLVGLTERGRPSRRVSEIIGDFTKVGLDAARRLDLRPLSRLELLKSLRHYRRSFEIISVECVSAKIAYLAAKDRRVDLLRFPTDGHVRLRYSLANIMRAGLELCLMHIRPAFANTRAFINTLEQIRIARENDILIVISSGANTIADLRPPRDLAAVAVLLGLETEYSQRCVSENPLLVVSRNRAKLAPSFVEEGVAIVREPGRIAEGRAT